MRQIYQVGIILRKLKNNLFLTTSGKSFIVTVIARALDQQIRCLFLVT